MTPFSSVAMLEKLALFRIAFCKAPVLSNAAWRWTSNRAATVLLLDMSLFPRHAHQLFQAGDALRHPSGAVFPQRAHAVCRRVVAQLLLRTTAVDQRAQAVIDGEHFVNSGAAAVASLVAGGAAHGGIGTFDRLPAFRAKPANQALRDHADQAGGEQEWLDAHVDQAVDGADRIVGVQR